MSVETSPQKSPYTLFVATGLMLFALFFGAGNLIFPAHMGQQAGVSYVGAVLGFVLTGAGLPLLGILAMAYSGARDVQHLASRVTPWFGLFFAVALYLSIGPLFALPRTGTVAFEVGIKPFLDDRFSETWSLLLFSMVFFALAYWLAMSPGKLIDRIGKVLTPVLLLGIGVLAFKTIVDPMGELQGAQGNLQHYPWIEGFLAGYQTMDALASLVFAIVVIGALQSAGVDNNETLMRLTVGAGILAGLCLALVYAAVAYMGASSVSVISWLDNGALVLTQIAHHYGGLTGNVLLMVIIFLACLSTAVGLIAACAEYFTRIIPKVSYTQFALLFTVVSCVLANKGLSGIIAFSVPVLMLLYPLTVVIILLTFLNNFFGGRQLVYVCTMGAVAVVGLLDAWQAAFGLSEASKALLDQWLPLYDVGLGWVVPAVVGFVVGLVLSTANREKRV